MKSQRGLGGIRPRLAPHARALADGSFKHAGKNFSASSLTDSSGFLETIGSLYRVVQAAQQLGMHGVRAGLDAAVRRVPGLVEL
ncbi:MAG: hypothetical protein V8S72_07930 [Oscillospiraceae bacterium]